MRDICTAETTCPSSLHLRGCPQYASASEQATHEPDQETSC